jgi:ubiquitin C-terminal hydrolase
MSYEKKSQIPCVVENGINTCYIDSLFVALFYKNSQIDKLLNIDPIDVSAIYLQELIKTKFVDIIRKNYIVTSDVINEIRNYAHISGWCELKPFIDDKEDVSEFYHFLINIFSAKYIEFDKISLDESHKITKELLPFIPINIGKKNSNIRIKDLFIDFLNNFCSDETNKITSCYKLSNIPVYLPFVINRYDQTGKKIKCKIDIMDQIKFFNIADKTQEVFKWKISSIICHIGSDIKSGHYYSYVLIDSKWLKFDDQVIPSFVQININDFDVKNDIMDNSAMLFYLLKNY